MDHTIHQQSIHFLATEIYRTFNVFSPSFIADIFQINADLDTDVSANTRSQSTFYNRFNPSTVDYGLKTLRCLGPKIWDIIPQDIKSATSLSAFKQKNKKLEACRLCPCRLCPCRLCPCRLCPCRLCPCAQTFVPNLGYI